MSDDNFSIDTVVQEMASHQGNKLTFFAENFGGGKVKDYDHWVDCNKLWQGENGFIIYLNGEVTDSHALPPVVIGSGKIPHHRYPLIKESTLSVGDTFSGYDWEKAQEMGAIQEMGAVGDLFKAFLGQQTDVLIPAGEVDSHSQKTDTNQAVVPLVHYKVILHQVNDTEHLLGKGPAKDIYFCAMDRSILK